MLYDTIKHSVLILLWFMILVLLVVVVVLAVVVVLVLVHPAVLLLHQTQAWEVTGFECLAIWFHHDYHLFCVCSVSTMILLIVVKFC